MQGIEQLVLTTIIELLWPARGAHKKGETSRKNSEVAIMQIFHVSRGGKILSCFLKIVLFLCMAPAIHQFN